MKISVLLDKNGKCDNPYFFRARSKSLVFTLMCIFYAIFLYTNLLEKYLSMYREQTELSVYARMLE